MQTEDLKRCNKTHLTEFVLSGLSTDPNLQIPLFILCLSIYIVTLLGNLTIITLIKITPGLQTPMYFFLINLSFVDLLYSSTITPNILANFLSVKKTISITACAVQMFFFIDLGSSEGMLLAVMAYDRYVAIYKPLYYPVLMNMICLVYTAGSINSFIHTYFAFRLPFCCSNHVNHFYCDINPILKLSCKDTSLNEILSFVLAGSIEVGSFLFIVISYIYILFAIFTISFTGGRRKSISTCLSHFTCVALFYCPILFMYLRPTSSYSVNQDWIVSVFYTVIIPMLNPIIYSLRNKDVKEALQKANISIRF
ncbi:LOW QUALITY PROTEIN: olfactory receptor 5AP2-like [Rhinophrynus dorsalis]